MLVFIKRDQIYFFKQNNFFSSIGKNDPFCKLKNFHHYWHKIAEILHLS